MSKMVHPLTAIYTPQVFCRDLMEIKGNGLQLGLYMALALGFKPLLDDWILKNRLPEFKKACRRYGIHIREDVIFSNRHKDEIPDSVIGKELLTTTCAYGRPLTTRTNEEVHVFLSKDRKNLKRAMWYPVIIDGRVIFGPRIDHLKYGRVLGYPDCCIRFFRVYNDWIRYSHLYEAFRNTRGKPVYLCNPILKDTIFSYIYHMPCSYDCAKTIKQAGSLRKEIKKKEPGYVQTTDAYLKQTFLVFYERKFYCLENAAVKDGILGFSRAVFVSHDRTKDTYGADLALADGLTLHGRTLTLFSKKSIIKKLDIPLPRFAPEYPFLIRFGDGREEGER